MRRIPIKAIQQATAHEFGVTVDSLVARGRTQPVALARQVAMYVVREAGYSYPAIAAAFGRTHATAIHAYRRVAELVVSDPRVAIRVRGIIRRLQKD